MGPAIIDRAHLLARLRERVTWDVLVIGGGATGLGIALDAAARGFRTALIEARDFASGTSSRSTKLVHGGVRYLAQGNIKLVREALAERALLLANAGALVRPLEFVVPCYRTIDLAALRIGLGLYDGLAGRRGVGATRWLSAAATQALLPGVRSDGLRGGVAYWDAQFDDARLAIALMRTALRLGAVALNYVRADELQLQGGRVERVVASDQETGERFELRAGVVFNASGVWADQVRAMAGHRRSLLTLSRGSHLVVSRSFMPSSAALMIPRTADGRVLFGIPWHDRLVLGTTDVTADGPTWEPQPSDAEADFILQTAAGYLTRPPRRNDVVASFAGLRPLFARSMPGATKTISREHAIIADGPNLLTITGGKWTTYRRMALDAIEQAVRADLLPRRPCTTADLALDVDDSLESAARDTEQRVLAGEFGAVGSYALLARQHEQARTIDDVVSRRLRVGLLDQDIEAKLRAAPALAA